MKKLFVIILSLITFFSTKIIAGDDKILSTEISSPTSFVQQPFDVLHYDVTEDFSKAPSKEMTGICRITVKWLEKSDTNKFYFHLRSLHIDSAFYESNKVIPEEVDTMLSATYHYEIPYQSQISKDTVVITIYYSGEMKSEPGFQSWGGVLSMNGILFAMGVGFRNNYVSATQHWMPCYDHPSDKATFRGKFKVPKGKAVASIGILKSHIQDSTSEEYEWEHNFPCSTYLYTFAVADYVSVIISDDMPPVVVYSKPEDTSKVKFVFQLLPQTIKAFEKRFGKYPFEKAGYVITPIGSMEHETMVSYDSSVLRYYYNLRDTLNMVGAHELSHQWFGDYVTCRDFRDAWLNEGFATFCESIWLEDLNGWDAYLASQQVKTEGYLGTIVAQEGELPLYDYPRSFPSSNYPRTIYEKGAAVLGMLRYELGDSIFFGVINEYLRRLALGNSTTDTLQKICEEYSRKKLDWFFKQWVFNKGWPILDIFEDVFVYDTSGFCKLTLRINQIDPVIQEPYINLPLEIKIIFNNDSISYRMIKINDWNDTLVLDSIPKFKQISYNRGHSLRALVEIHPWRTDVEESYKISNDILAYPNPANNYIRLLFRKNTGWANIKIYNLLGEEMESHDKYIEKQNEMMLLDVSNLSDGIYIIVVKSVESADSIKITIQH